MEHKFILVLCISLLYKESLLNLTENSEELVTESLKGVVIPETKITTSKLRETMIGCRKLILQMIKNGPGYKYSKSTLKQQFNLLFNDDPQVLESLNEILNGNDIAETVLQNDTVFIKRQLNSFNARRKFKDMLNSHARKCAFDIDSIDIPSYAAKLTEELETFVFDAEDASRHPSIVDCVDFSNRGSIADLLRSAKKIDEGTELYRCGWQSINEMMAGGFRPGESMLVSALEHNFKSGFCNALMTHFPLFNVAPECAHGKKPLLVRISFENDTVTDVPWIYKYIKENIEGTEEIKVKDIDPDIAAEYVTNHMTQNGWHFINYRIDPSNFNNKAIIDLLISIEKDGFDIKILLIDYLSMILPSDAKSELYRDNFRRVRNFCSRRKIFFYTPHQMSSEAKELTRGEAAVQSLVKVVAGKSYYAGCKQLGQEPDIELCIHIEIRQTPDGKKSYLDMHRGKHRGRTTIVRPEKLYSCIPFKQIGILPWDMGKPNSAIHKPGADYQTTPSESFDWN